MGSLDKIKDDAKTIEKWRKKYSGDCVISDKLDGNSGLLVMNPKTGANTLYSRGDGEYGQDLSGILKYIKLPKVKETCAVRGELIISKKIGIK
jgi:NAD-dependent DNA ligase